MKKMERLDFASVTAVLQKNIGAGCSSNQIDFVHSLFMDVVEDFDLDQGLVSRWLTGRAQLSPKILDFYRESSNREKLLHRIEENILPKMTDSAMAVQGLYDLLMQAPNVTPQKKSEMTKDFSFEKKNDEASFITEILCLGIYLPFEKRDARNKGLIAPGNLSPTVVDYIFDTSIPRACRWFLGRTQELEQLHSLLIDHSKVFVHGTPVLEKVSLLRPMPVCTARNTPMYCMCITREA